MRPNRVLLCILAGAVGYAFGVNVAPADAQQTFLPPAFQPGSVLTLNDDSKSEYAVLGQQGAWIQVQRKSDGKTANDMWIYAPSGTIWTKVK